MANETEKERIGVWISRSTVKFVDSVWPQRNFKSRSAFVDEAMRRYAQRLQKAALKRQLRAGYKAQAEADRAMVNEWEIASRELIDPDSRTE